MKKIGLTGGIGAGKSFVARIFRQMGIPVYNADLRARWIINHDPSVVERVTLAFGRQVYQGGRLDRERLAEIVFGQPRKLEQLNAIVHPEVRNDGQAWFLKQKRLYPHLPYALKEAALTFESGSETDLNAVVVVTASTEIRLQRTIERDGATRRQVQARMANQMPEEEKIRRADYTVFNGGDEALLPQIWRIHQHLIRRD